MVDIGLFVQQIINGLSFGGQLALIGVGFTLIWGVARVLNFAHGAVFMLGAYTGYFSLAFTGSWLVAIVTGMAVTFVLGYATEVFLVKPLRGRREFDIASMVVTLGLWFVLEHSARFAFTSHQRGVSPIVPGTWEVYGVVISINRVIIFVISVAAIGVLFAIIKYTKFGLAVRAAAEDSQTTQLMGVDIHRVYALTFGLSAALAGLAGVLLAPIFSVYPAVGNQPFLLAFIVVMIGGLGSVRGTLIAALVLAMVRSLAMIWTSAQGALIVLFLCMALVLIVSPDGIAGWLES
ncbi:branched-chain amino acid ABC transporter permease [Natronorarus salvus]|uniref:branched-chain amino acid ABC transporter permease n=1 Tax=Natronorarus salvus TaxID=3117733 RepID=UPI002F26D88A